MKVLITGHTGFLGRQIAANLAADYVGISRSAGAPAHDLGLSPPPLPDTRFDLVVHAAGTAHGSFSEEEHFQNHVLATQNLLAALRPSPPRGLILISSVAIYGRLSGLEIDEEQIGEGSELTPYGAAKRQAEERCRTWSTRNRVPVTILRLPLVAAPSPPGNLGSMLKGLRSGHYFGPGDGKSRRSIVLAKDIASVIPRAISVPGTYNLTDGHHPSLSELEDALCRALGRSSPRRIPLAALYPVAALGSLLNRAQLPFPINLGKLSKLTHSLTFSDSKARELLDWKPSRVVDCANEVVS